MNRIYEILMRLMRSGFFYARTGHRKIQTKDPKPRSHKSVGDHGEYLAAESLKKNGYKILERSHRNTRGEIDIIALRKKTKTVIFVEVKTWATAEQGGPSDAVDLRKQRKLTQVALEYLKRHRLLESSCRFDVIEVILGPADSPSIRHFENAFEPTDSFQMFS